MWKAVLGLLPKRAVFEMPPDDPSPAPKVEPPDSIKEDEKAEDLKKEKLNAFKKSYEEVHESLVNHEDPFEKVQERISSAQETLTKRVEALHSEFTKKAEQITDPEVKKTFVENLAQWKQNKDKAITEGFQKLTEHAAEIKDKMESNPLAAMSVLKEVVVALHNLRETVLGNVKKKPEVKKPKEKKESKEKGTGKAIETKKEPGGGESTTVRPDAKESELTKIFGQGLGKWVAKMLKSLGVFFTMFKDKNGVIAGFTYSKDPEQHKVLNEQMRARRQADAKLGKLETEKREGVDKELGNEFGRFLRDEDMFRPASISLALQMKKYKNMTDKDGKKIENPSVEDHDQMNHEAKMKQQ